MSGKEIRLKKLLSNGNAVVVAADHGSYMGPFKGIENLPQNIKAFKKADAVLLMPGMVKHCKDFFAEKDSPLCIIRLNWASDYCSLFSDVYTKGYNERICDVKTAVALGADLVIASLVMGSDEVANTRNMTQFGEFVAEARELGIPLIGEYIPMDGIDRFEGGLSNVLLGVRACTEFGADLIKTVYVDEFEQISNSAIVPVLALGGGLTEKPSQSFGIAEKAIEEGARGVVFGRNVVCAKNPSAYLDCLISVVKHGMSSTEAEKAYFETIG